MTPEEFRQAVLGRARGRSVPDWAVTAAVDVYIDQRAAALENVEPCVRMARRFAEAAGRKKPDARRPTEVLPPVVLMKAQRIEQIRPRVEQLRRDLFGRTDPPFSSAKEAAQWVESQAPKKRRRTANEAREAEALLVEIEQRRERYNEVVRPLGRELTLSEVIHSLAYPNLKGPGGVGQKSVYGVPKLERLEAGTRDLARVSGFDQAQVVAYVLTGAEPVLPPARAVITYGRPSGDGSVTAGQRIESIPRKSLRLETFTPLTYAESRRLHRAAQATWGARFRKSLTVEDSELLDFVNGTKGVSWEARRRQWNATHPDRPYKDRRGLKQRYNRLLKKPGMLRPPHSRADGRDAPGTPWHRSNPRLGARRRRRGS